MNRAGRTPQVLDEILSVNVGKKSVTILAQVSKWAQQSTCPPIDVEQQRGDSYRVHSPSVDDTDLVWKLRSDSAVSYVPYLPFISGSGSDAGHTSDLTGSDPWVRLVVVFTLGGGRGSSRYLDEAVPGD